MAVRIKMSLSFGGGRGPRWSVEERKKEGMDGLRAWRKELTSRSKKERMRGRMNMTERDSTCHTSNIAVHLHPVSHVKLGTGGSGGVHTR